MQFLSSRDFQTSPFIRLKSETNPAAETLRSKKMKAKKSMQNSEGMLHPWSSIEVTHIPELDS
jgi:hypothetical protein